MPTNNKILFFSDRQLRHSTDDTFDILGKNFDDYLYCYHKSGFPQIKNSIKSKFYDYDKISEIPKDFEYIYIRADHYFKIFNDDKFLNILNSFDNPKIIFGYHCHRANKNTIEKTFFNLADAHVFINERSKNYFHNLYPEIKYKKYFILPSLYLPPRNWYGNFKEKFPYRNLCLSSISTSHNLIPEARYNDFEILKFIGENNKFDIDVFGKFFNDNDRQSYMSLKGNFRFYDSVQEDYLDFFMKYHHFSLMNGFLPSTKTPEFEHQNYALRLNSFIKNNVVPLIASGTTEWHQKEAEETNFGYVFSKLSDLNYLGEIYDSYKLTKEKWEYLVERHSFESFADDFANFIKSI